MAVKLIGQKAMNFRVSSIDGVSDSTKDKAQAIGSKAQARLASHHKTGAAQISITEGSTDAFVNLDDEAALSIEFGHMHNKSGKHVAGLYIITGAAGLI
jgi:hypothetical protein